MVVFLNTSLDYFCFCLHPQQLPIHHSISAQQQTRAVEPRRTPCSDTSPRQKAALCIRKTQSPVYAPKNVQSHGVRPSRILNDVAAGRENGRNVRRRKKMISASVRSGRVMSEGLNSPTATSHGKIPSISRPACRNTPNKVGLDHTVPSFTQRSI